MKLPLRKRIKADIHAMLMFMSKHRLLKKILPVSEQRLLEIQYDWIMSRNIYVPLNEINDFCIKVTHASLGQGKEHIYLSLEPENRTPSQIDLLIESLDQRLEDYRSNRAAGVSMHQVCMNDKVLEETINALTYYRNLEETTRNIAGSYVVDGFHGITMWEEIQKQMTEK